jgi:hypothetical protein
VEETIRMVAARGWGYYAIDPGSDTVVDSRLRTQVLAVDDCPACGASIGLRVAADLSTPPSCPYCQKAISSDVLNQLKMQLLGQIRQSPAPQQKALLHASPFNPTTFIVLMLVFWPAALFYAMSRARK